MPTHIPGSVQRLLARLPDVAELQANERFARMWAEGTVVEHSSRRKAFVHPQVGPVTLDCDVFTASCTDVRIVAYTAEPGTEDASRFDLIRTLGLTDVGASLG